MNRILVFLIWQNSVELQWKVLNYIYLKINTFQDMYLVFKISLKYTFLRLSGLKITITDISKSINWEKWSYLRYPHSLDLNILNFLQVRRIILLQEAVGRIILLQELLKYMIHRDVYSAQKIGFVAGVRLLIGRMTLLSLNLPIGR